MKPAISVRNLSKCYKLGVINRKTLVDEVRYWLSKARGRDPREHFTKIGHTATEVRRVEAENTGDDRFWALKDVSFDVQPGEVVGIIGRNGAGKSTLLKILTRITEPTSGEAFINGRVGSLLEVGTGFHPELTGRENIYMNGTILGMTKGEIDHKFDEIVNFSGIDKFLDTPVKRYSSGMKVRLAFSVAAHLDQKILIVDEVLAVGDADFQHKCIRKMESISSNKRKTIFFVSHNIGAIRNLCPRALLLSHGSLLFDGLSAHTIDAYFKTLTLPTSNVFKNNPDRSGDGRIIFTDARIRNARNEVTTKLVAGETADFEFDYIRYASLIKVDISLTVFNNQATAIAHLSTRLKKIRLPLHHVGSFVCRVPRIPFLPGRYRVAATLQESERNCDLIPNIFMFDVIGSVFFKDGRVSDARYSTVLVDHEWDYVPVERGEAIEGMIA